MDPTTPTDARTPEIEALIAEFDAQLDEWDLWDSDPSEAFEHLAAEFYRDTGFMAPGKSLPLEMSSVDADAERHQRYDEWIAVRKSVRRKLFRDVAAVLGRRSPQPQTRVLTGDKPAGLNEADLEGPAGKPSAAGSEDAAVGTFVPTEDAGERPAPDSTLGRSPQPEQEQEMERE